jgi:DNA repair exonuclease SbcCD nuclease subunit
MLLRHSSHTARKKKGQVVKEMKILHTGDWHLKDSVADEAAACLDTIIKTAKSERPDLIAIAGDMTDRDDTRLDSKTSRLLMDTVYDLAQVAPVAICGGTPYHDGRIPELVDHLRLGQRVRVTIDRPEQVSLSYEGFHGAIKGIAIMTLFPTPTKRWLNNAGTIDQTNQQVADAVGLMLTNFGLKAMKFEGAPHILIGHFSVRGAKISEHQTMIGREIEISVEQLAMARANLVCLSHIHKAQRILRDSAGGPLGPDIFYCGSLYSKDRGELDDKGFWTHEVDAHGSLASRFWLTPAKKRIVIKFDLTAVEADDLIIANAQMAPAILEGQDNGAHVGNIVHVSYRIWQDKADLVDREAVREKLIAAGAADAIVEVLRVPRENVRCKDYFERPSLMAKLQQQADLRGEGPLDNGIADKVAMLETMEPEKIWEGLPK